MNSILDWNANLAAIFEAKLTYNWRTVPVPFYCLNLRDYKECAKISSSE